MATSKRGSFGRESFVQRGPLVGVIALCTLTLTAVFVGVVGLTSGQAAEVVTRLPLYVLASAVLFLGVLLVADHSHEHGQTVLAQAVAVGAVGFVTVSLGSEGVVYAVTYPEAVVTSHLFVYLLSAAIIASGLGYWAARNWEDVRGLARQNSLQRRAKRSRK